MMKKLILIFFLLLEGFLLSAQENGDKVFFMKEIAKELEEISDYRIFYNPIEVQELKIRETEVSGDPLNILFDILKNTPFKISVFGNDIFITKERALITELPENYFESQRRNQEYEIEDFSFSLKREQKATSENKIYEIGDVSNDQSKQATLTGTVIDFKTGEPMVGITLFISKPMIGVTTDAFGYYSIQLPIGRHDIQIRGMGVKDTRRQVALYGDGKLDIELEEQVFSLKEVTVSSEKVENIRSTTIGVERLKIKEIKNIPTAFGETDILRVVMSLPGVKSVGEASSGFNVRGGATDQNLILFNDGVVYNPTHLFGMFSAFNPDVVRDMELYKSSIPAKYGGRISSVLDINSREGNKKEFTGSASIGLLTSRVTLEGPLFSEKTSFIIGGRTTYSDWLLNTLPEKSGYKDGSAGFYDLNAHINHKFNERNNFYINGYFSKDRFSFEQDEKYGYKNANLSLKWRHIFNSKFIGVFTTGYDHYDYLSENSQDESTAYDLTFDIHQFFGKTDFTWYLNDKHTLDFGLNTLHYNLNPGKYLPKNENSLVIPDILEREKALESALYLGERWDITTQLSLNVGIRYSIFNVLGPRTYNEYKTGELPTLINFIDKTEEGKGIFKTYHGPEFRISGRYEFQDGFSVKAGFNTMRQNIHKLSNTTIMSPTDTWKLSDVNIKPQTGNQWAVGLYKNVFNNTIELSIEGYYKKMNDYLDYRSGAQLIMNHHIETDIINTEGRAYGVEFMMKKTVGKLNGWLSYTYSKSELRQNNPSIKEPVNGGNWYPSDYDKPHEVKLVGNYKFTHRFSFSMNCDYSTGRPITLPEAKYNFAGGEYVYYSGRNQYRILDFFRMDMAFNIEPSHNLKLLTHSTISLGVYNVTGRKNAYSVYYVSEDGVLQGYKLAIFGVPIPYISYNIKF